MGDSHQEHQRTVRTQERQATNLSRHLSNWQELKQLAEIMKGVVELPQDGGPPSGGSCGHGEIFPPASGYMNESRNPAKCGLRCAGVSYQELWWVGSIGRVRKSAGCESYCSFFFALCCLGKIPGGAPFSQLHKSGNGSRVDRP